MVSIETEARLAKLFLSLAEGERTVEVSRQVLSDNQDFDAYQVFKYLDVEGKNRVDAVNIIDFLHSKGVHCSNQEAQLIVLFYDEDADGTLSYCEFLSLVQSEKSFRRTNSYTGNNKLSFNVEYSLGKLFERELDLARNTIGLLHDIRARYDFNIHDLYHLVKSYNSITTDSIKNFLDRNHASYWESDVKAIVKRLDLNVDGRVDLNDFHTFLGYPSCLRCCQCTKLCDDCCCCVSAHSPKRCPRSPIRTCSPRRCSPHCSPRRCSPCHYSPHCSPRRCSPRCSPRRDDLRSSNQNNISSSNGFNVTGSPRRFNETSNSMYNMGSPEVKKISPNLSLRLSPERKFSPHPTYNGSSMNFRNSPRNSPLRNGNNNYNSLRNSHDSYEKTQFIDYLKELMKAEANLERQKIDWTWRSDFNVEDAFRVFELNSRGFLTEDDLKFGLNLWEVYPTNSDLRLIMKRFDLQKKGTINYADFFDMVTPFEKDYRTMVENRPPNSCCTCRCPDIFMFTTKLYLKNLFTAIIDYENKLNVMRRGFSTLRYKWRDVFKDIDVVGLGYFTDTNLEIYWKANYSFTTIKDSDLLFIRLDRNRNGKVGFFEVDDELTPSY